jgi:hypothetical protein
MFACSTLVFDLTAMTKKDIYFFVSVFVVFLILFSSIEANVVVGSFLLAVITYLIYWFSKEK